MAELTALIKLRRKMKTKELKSKLTEAGVSEEALDGLVAYIMAENGTDVNNAKSKSAEEVEELKNQVAELSNKNAELTKSYKDYDELKKFKDDTILAQEEGQKLDFLKVMKVKEPYQKMVMGQIDWSKGTFDKEKKTYTGLDEQFKNSREQYKDLYESDSQQSVVFGGALGNGKQAVTPNTSMNAFIRGINQK